MHQSWSANFLCNNWFTAGMANTWIIPNNPWTIPTRNKTAAKLNTLLTAACQIKLFRVFHKTWELCCNIWPNPAVFYLVFQLKMSWTWPFSNCPPCPGCPWTSLPRAWFQKLVRFLQALYELFDGAKRWTQKSIQPGNTEANRNLCFFHIFFTLVAIPGFGSRQGIRIRLIILGGSDLSPVFFSDFFYATKTAKTWRLCAAWKKTVSKNTSL